MPLSKETFNISSYLYREARASDIINKTTKKLHKSLGDTIKDPRNEESSKKQSKLT
jgi:hypothetical protein